MPSTFRVYLSLVPLFAGFYFAWGQGMAHPLTAFGFVGAGILTAIAALLGFFDTWNSTIWTSIAGIWTALGFIALIAESPFTNPQLQHAQISLFNRLLEISTSYPGGAPLTQNERELAERGWQACALQSSLDELEFTRSAMKAEHLGPGATLIDEGIEESAAGPKPVRCLDYYKRLHATRPDLFFLIDRENPWLVKAA